MWNGQGAFRIENGRAMLIDDVFHEFPRRAVLRFGALFIGGRLVEQFLKSLRLKVKSHS